MYTFLFCFLVGLRGYELAKQVPPLEAHLQSILLYFFKFIFIVVLGLHCSIYRSSYNISNLSYLNSPTLVIFGDGVSPTICLDWPQMPTLIISVSKGARITGMSHWHPAEMHNF
jgi:hypothetical protein